MPRRLIRTDLDRCEKEPLTENSIRSHLSPSNNPEHHVTITSSLGVLNIGGRQKRRLTAMQPNVVTQRIQQQGVLNNKGKAIAYEDTSMETQYIDATHTIPNAFSPENQNHKMGQNHLPDACISSGPTASCSQDTSNLYIDIGDCEYACEYCNAAFWYSERLKSNCHRRTREYQLPSSGTLGTIVFQPDADSQTDYDIIIEYKDRGPQRINKLHSSYMSLQYPLLFVYGQPGFNTKMSLKGVNANYIGCYISSGEKGTIEDPMRDQMVNRKIEIQNLNGNSIELTLWDDLAETLKKDEIDRLERPIIIAVTSCKVSKYYNKLQLSSTPATYYYINPKIPQLERYRAE
ncbi:helitron helicase-like domain-containing protein [Artemisia annua]|uniref:Helitron helicase-like domain-containing protein n=1 Tax=Artemisia annua TaxID=35608 RepID=A0A2U1Q7L2_ARTAN|nr:helitron helicase-like domain-containing protein [Artemisia annua]